MTRSANYDEAITRVHSGVIAGKTRLVETISYITNVAPVGTMQLLIVAMKIYTDKTYSRIVRPRLSNKNLINSQEISSATLTVPSARCAREFI